MPGGIGELGSEPQLWELGSEPQLATGNWGQSRNSPISSTDERELGSEPQLADLQHGNWGQSGNFWGIGVRAATRRSPAPTKVDRRPSCRSDPNLQSPTPISASCGSDPRFRRRWIVVQVAALTPISIAALTPISPISPDPISPIAALTPLVSGQKPSKLNWLEISESTGATVLSARACCSGIFSKSVTDRICSSVYSEGSRCRSFLTIATST